MQFLLQSRPVFRRVSHHFRYEHEAYATAQ